MRRSPMPLAEFNSRNHVTPTGLAEEVYQAKLKQHRPMPIGPAGLPIPSATAIYRPTMDGDLLKKLAGAAYEAHRAAVLPGAEWGRAAAVLADELERVFPPAEMAVLAKHRCARRMDRIFVELATPTWEKAATVSLPRVVLLPTTSPGTPFHVPLGGRPETDTLPVPAALVSFFEAVRDLRRIRQTGFFAVLGMPARFRSTEGRWPRWSDVERSFPRLGEWVAHERGALS